MRARLFALRNLKEITRDPLSAAFGIAFPVALLLLLQMLKKGVAGTPDSLFALDRFAPAMAVFGLSFLMMFVGTLVANDRTSAFLQRLKASPMGAWDYVAGYLLPMLPMALVQGAVCFAAAGLCGLKLTPRMAPALLYLLPTALLFISIGLLLGTLLSASGANGISSVIVQAAALLSGAFFPLELLQGTFKTICYALPFAHGVDAVAQAMAGQYGKAAPHAAVTCGYALALCLLAIWVFHKKARD